jgi:hypothetical protein
VDTPPPLPSEKETFGSEIPSWPGGAVQIGSTPGYEADTVQHVGGSVTPLPEQQTPTLILNVGQVDKAFENVIEGMSNTTRRGSEYVNWTGSGGMAAAQDAFNSLPAIAGTEKKYPNWSARGDFDGRFNCQAIPLSVRLRFRQVFRFGGRKALVIP